MSLIHLFASIEQDPAAKRARVCHDIAMKVGRPADLRPESLHHSVEMIRSQVLSDRVAFICNVTATNENGLLTLSGESERPEFVEILRGVFLELGFTSVVDRVEILPDLKQDPEPFAVVIKPSVQMWSGRSWGGTNSVKSSQEDPTAPPLPEPPHNADPLLTGTPMDEALFGEPVYIYRDCSVPPANRGRAAGSVDTTHLHPVYLIKNFSGYWGYAAKDGLRRVSKREFIELINTPKALLLADYKSGSQLVPGGCRLPIKRWGAGRSCVLTGPSGEEIKVPKSICLKSNHDKDGAEVIERARSLLERHYKLGGRNGGEGIDCSGLVQFAYRSLGVNLARDAKQQYLNGDLILPCVEEALQAGDALFFMNPAGQVGHTGLYIGNGKFIHAQGKSVQIQSINPGDKDYFTRFERDYIGAKRYWW